MFVCGPQSVIGSAVASDLPVLLFDIPSNVNRLSAGGAVRHELHRRRFDPPQLAWEFASIAHAAMVADSAVLREKSPDGWTRDLSLAIAVSDPAIWHPLAYDLEQALGFLTTDLWHLTFIPGGELFDAPPRVTRADVDGIQLLSGGLDSLIGGIDLVRDGLRLLPVSKVVRGDAEKQVQFAQTVLRTNDLLQLNDNAETRRSEKETSQRARSLIFLAFSVLAASSTARHEAGQRVPIYLCENGFIAINPPLTLARLGSLSTRTAHPEFLTRVQSVLDRIGLNLDILTPYAFKTKGEMMLDCADQELLTRMAPVSTSCGRFQRFNYTHCGRCVPCQIRRASFLKWGGTDSTEYVYADLSRRDGNHARFDDVMSVSMALAAASSDGFDSWLGTALSSPAVTHKAELRSMLQRGLDELAALHRVLGVW